MHLGPALEPETSSDDRAWAALRYVLDELTPLETARFEATLVHDQAAREALAAAVDQVGAMGIVAREALAAPLGSFRLKSNRHRRGLLRLAAAAAIVAVVGWGSMWFVPRDSAAVALAWSNIRDEAAATDSVVPISPDASLVDPVGAGDPGNTDSTFTEVAAERPLPSWMMAAVAPATPDDGSTPAPEEN